MMKISEIVQTEGWRTFMAKLYGWGAAVVLLGALFKIQHWPGASLMLTVGMLTEVVIFFFSSFEPIHEDLDWTLVYPELAGIEEDGEDGHKHKKLHEGHEHAAAAVEQPKMVGLKKLEVMLESVEVNSDLFTNLGSGLNKLTKTTSNITDITEATVATKDYASKVRVATESVGLMSDSFLQAKDNLSNSIDTLSSSYKDTAQLIHKAGTEAAEKFKHSGDGLLSSYQELSDSIHNGATIITDESKSYKDKIETINKNLSALNSVYEIQIKETNDHLTNTKDIFKGFDKMMTNLKDSAESTENYKKQVDKLSTSIADLNNIYGNMLSSLNSINN